MVNRKMARAPSFCIHPFDFPWALSFRYLNLAEQVISYQPLLVSYSLQLRSISRLKL